MITNKLLAKIAIYTTMIGTTGCVYIFLRKQKELRNSPYVTESMKILEEHKDAVEYLGKPLKFGYLPLHTENNFCDGYKAQFDVPVSGHSNSGSLHLWARRENPQQNWDVYRLEFSPSSDTTKRLVIKQ